jgi:hypothetical protein
MLACFPCQIKRQILSEFAIIISDHKNYETFVTDFDNLSLFNKPFIFIVGQHYHPAAYAAGSKAANS